MGTASLYHFELKGSVVLVCMCFVYRRVRHPYSRARERPHNKQGARDNKQGHDIRSVAVVDQEAPTNEG